MCSGRPEHWLHTLSPPGISHTRLVSSLLGTAPLDPALCPAGASRILVLHGRGRRESLTRPFLNHKNHQAKSFWGSDQTMESSGEPTTAGAEFWGGADSSCSHEQALAAPRRAGSERPGANGSVCVQQGTRGPDGQLVIQPFLKNSPLWRSSHLPKVLQGLCFTIIRNSVKVKYVSLEVELLFLVLSVCWLIHSDPLQSSRLFCSTCVQPHFYSCFPALAMVEMRSEDFGQLLSFIKTAVSSNLATPRWLKSLQFSIFQKSSKYALYSSSRS